MTLITGWRSLKAKVKTTLGAKRDPSLITPDTLERRLKPNGAVTAFTSPAPGFPATPVRMMGKSGDK